MSLLDNISELIGQKGIGQMAQKVGGDEESVSKAISAALPTLMGAMGRKADSNEGQGLLQNWLEKNDDDDAPDDSNDFFSQGRHEKEDHGSLLDGLFGGNREKVESGIGQASGLSAGQAGGLMKMLAPFVMSQLMKKGKQEKSSGSVFDLIRSGGKEAEEKSGGGSLVGRLLDQDGDGDFDFGDMAKLGMSLFTKK